MIMTNKLKFKYILFVDGIKKSTSRGNKRNPLAAKHVCMYTLSKLSDVATSFSSVFWSY